MKSVKIAELKAKLSSFIKRASLGEEIVVYDRNLAVAKIVPIRKDGLSIIPAKKTWAEAFREAKAIPLVLPKSVNFLKDLLEMREEERSKR